MKILIIIGTVIFLGLMLNVSYEKTAKSPDGYVFTERFNIQTQLDLKLERGKQKTAP